MAKASKVEVMHDLPDDVINFILETLPVTSLLRFRYVCKQWNETITSQTFAAQHIKRASTLSACTLVHSYDPTPDNNLLHAIQISTSHRHNNPATLPYTINLGFHIVRLLETSYSQFSSCNGLLCVARVPNIDYHLSYTVMQIYNPATGSCMEIERIPTIFNQIRVRNIILGFGYDPYTDDYKIIYVIKKDDDISYQVLVMSLKSKAWRSIDISTSPDLSIVDFYYSYNNMPVSCSGCVYWIVCSNHRYRHMILKFNLTDERFELLQFPYTAIDEEIHNNFFAPVCSTLASHKGSLYIFMPLDLDYRRISLSTGITDIWMLECIEGNKAKWLKVGIIPTFKGNILRPLGFNCSGHVIMSKWKSIGSWSKYLLYTYLPKQNEFVELCTTNELSNVHFVQMETLALNWL